MYIQLKIRILNIIQNIVGIVVRKERHTKGHFLLSVDQ